VPDPLEAVVDHGSELRSELLRRRQDDLTARASLRHADSAVRRELLRVTDDNTRWIKSVVHRHGWPGRSLVGEEGSEAAWLLVQHSDRDLEFQARCVELLREAVLLSEASPGNLAHLIDRVQLASGETQLYGTQLNAFEGRYVAPRLRDPDLVDLRRASVGLDSLQRHLARALEQFGKPLPAVVTCPNCGRGVELWLPEIGGTRSVQCQDCGFRLTVRARIEASPRGEMLFADPILNSPQNRS
jgi:DNA-directed RNA polymerase subunit RPC12/RpoP